MPKNQMKISQEEYATVVCLTFLRSAGTALSSAIEARAPLSESERNELVELSRRVNSLTTKLWDKLGTDE